MKLLIFKVIINSFGYNTESSKTIQQISSHLVQFVTLEWFLSFGPVPNYNDIYKRNFNRFDINKF